MNDAGGEWQHDTVLPAPVVTKTLSFSTLPIGT